MLAQDSITPLICSVTVSLRDISISYSSKEHNILPMRLQPQNYALEIFCLCVYLYVVDDM